MMRPEQLAEYDKTLSLCVFASNAKEIVKHSAATMTALDHLLRYTKHRESQRSKRAQKIRAMRHKIVALPRETKQQ